MAGVLSARFSNKRNGLSGTLHPLILFLALSPSSKDLQEYAGLQHTITDVFSYFIIERPIVSPVLQNTGSSKEKKNVFTDCFYH